MRNTTIVNNKEDLKAALKNKADNIVITDPTLAKQIKLIRAAPYAKIAAVVAAGTVAATNFWNPAGVAGATLGAVAATSIGAPTIATLLILITAIGGLVLVMHNGYELGGSGEHTVETEKGKHTVKGDFYFKKSK